MFSSLYKLRYATEEEVKKIAPTADTVGTVVIVGEHTKNEDKQYAVLRQVLEVDPILPGDNKKVIRPFIWALEQHLRLSGHLSYYFNVHVSDESWITRIEEKEGAVIRLSTEPEYRFKRNLT